MSHGAKIASSARNRYVSEAERAGVGNEKLTIGCAGLQAGAWVVVWLGLGSGGRRDCTTTSKSGDCLRESIK